MQKQLEILRKILDKRFFALLASYFAFAFIFAFLAKWLADFKLLVKIDVAVQWFILNARVDSLNKFFEIFTELGDTKFMAILALVASLLFFIKKYYRYSIGIALSVGVAEIVSIILKTVIGRHRPPNELALVAQNGASFPSGHTIAAMAFYGFLIYFFNKEIKNTTTKNILIIFCGLMILLSGFARIYLGAHWPSDVAASYALGGVWVAIIISLVEKNSKVLEN